MWLWVLGAALIVSLTGNIWQAGEIAGLKARKTPIGNRAAKAQDQSERAMGQTSDSGSDSGSSQGGDTGSVTDFTQGNQTGPTPRGVWAVDTGNNKGAAGPRLGTQRDAELPKGKMPAIMRLYLVELEKAFEETSDAPGSAEIAGEVLDQATMGQYADLDLHIVALRARFARLDAIEPPELGVQHHRMSMLEVRQGEKLLESLMRSREGKDPQAMELADQQAAQLMETHRQVEQMTAKLKSGRGQSSSP
jgi:hypothetical protein